MKSIVRYRHNAMRVESIDTFANIRGGFYNGLRDVYFVRALGETDNMSAFILTLDQRMDCGAENDRFIYLRISGLPNLADKENSEFYAQIYDRWRSGEPVRLKTASSSQRFDSVLSSATEKAIHAFRLSRRNVTDTIVKNFIVKLWYWLDRELTAVIQQWTERLSVKIIADNVTKVQEYLFYYMATLLGCDVLIFNTRADLKANETTLGLSNSLILGAYGKAEIPKHVSSEMNKSQRDKTKRPMTSGHQLAPNREVSNRCNTGFQNEATINRKPGTDTKAQRAPTERTDAGSIGQRHEKTFEELAELASSIVLIAVFDLDGKPVATGSGIMIGKKGFILTNCHVVRAGKVYAVRIENDEEVYVTNEIIKYNPQLDLAVIRIDKPLNPLQIYDGRTNLVRGQKVVAIGSPLGLFNSVSDGIISGFRDIKDVKMIQFTAPISHGSSGGAVLNLYGEVIGISTAGLDSGQNINLAVSYEDITIFAKGFF